jgi:hypothetical protein
VKKNFDLKCEQCNKAKSDMPEKRFYRLAGQIDTSPGAAARIQAGMVTADQAQAVYGSSVAVGLVVQIKETFELHVSGKLSVADRKLCMKQM